MASPSSALTLGLGTWGSASLVLTLGFGSSQDVVVAGPYCVVDRGVYVPGRRDAVVFTPGAVSRRVYVPGAVDQEICK